MSEAHADLSGPRGALARVTQGLIGFLFGALTGTRAEEREAAIAAGDFAARRTQFRLSTFMRLRWAAVTGQALTVLTVRFVFGYDIPWIACLALVLAAALVNVVLARRYRGRPADVRVAEDLVFPVLAFDIVQLGLLIFFTGGMTNPFAIFVMAPVMAASTTMTADRIWRLGLLAVIFVTLVAFWYVPLPWYEPGEVIVGDPSTGGLPPLYIGGHWTAIVVMIAFTVSYAFRAADEGRKLADALAATELVLQREQHLSALDGLAAAAAHELGTPLGTIAMTAGEIARELEPDDPLVEDVALIRSQAKRCREILGRLSAMGSQGDAHLASVAPSVLVEDVIAPHRGFEITIETQVEGQDESGGEDEGEPLIARNPAILYGLGNLVENAVDFARSRVTVTTVWTQDTLAFQIADDGPGFPAETLARLGEPFVSRRNRGRPRPVGAAAAAGRTKKGMGLGIFIAKTLLERTGGSITFANNPGGGGGSGAGTGTETARGARITVAWPRASVERPDAAMASQHRRPAQPPGEDDVFSSSPS